MYNVIIIGASFAGSKVAACLDVMTRKRDVVITIIERQEQFFVGTATGRALANPQFAALNAFIPYNNLFRSSRHRILHSVVSSVNEHSVVLDDGTELAFDYLVLAMGCTYDMPLKMQLNTVNETQAQLVHYSSLIQDAPTIVVVGGGRILAK
jgi:NADH dehydrogenase FAD-containing subunit